MARDNSIFPEPSMSAKEGEKVRRRHSAPYDTHNDQPRDNFLPRLESVCRYRQDGNIKIKRLHLETETRAWVAEFKSNMAQLEQQARSRLQQETGKGRGRS